MSIGKLRQRFALQAPFVTPDDSGGIKNNWVTVGSIWGRLIPLPPSQAWAQQTLERRVTHNLRLRWRSDLIAGMRLQRGSRLFLIHTLCNLDETYRWIEALVEETT